MVYRRIGVVAALVALFWAGCCGGSVTSAPADSASQPAGAADSVTQPRSESDASAFLDRSAQDAAAADASGGGASAKDVAVPPSGLRVVTFNTGSGLELAHDSGPDDGYGTAEAVITDTWYGNGLAFVPFVAATRAWLAETDPDIVVFQEMFWSGECPEIPVTAQAGFVCEGYQPGAPSVVQQVLGEGWQIACHPGKPDKCAAVNARYGRFEGCDADLCLDGLWGAPIEGCGKGARVARGRIRRLDGSILTLVSVHGSSGLTEDDMACRVAQVERVFVDLGDGGPAVDPATPNLVMGDLNTDPALMAGGDPSADRWRDFVGPDTPFHFLTALGGDAPGSYAGVFNIDHVVSDTFTGSCWIAGLTSGHASVLGDAVFFDHKPVVCDVE